MKCFPVRHLAASSCGRYSQTEKAFTRLQLPGVYIGLVDVPNELNTSRMHQGVPFHAIGTVTLGPFPEW